MSGFRAYHEFEGELFAGDEITLSADESRHLCGSLRAKNGDALSVFDLEGAVYSARIEDASQKSARVKILERIETRHTGGGVSLAICLPNSKVFDDILRQSVEAGARAVYPLFSENSQVRLDAKDLGRKHEKWRAKVIEAVKQSANFAPFYVAKAQGFEDFMKSAGEIFSLKYAASLEDDAQPLMRLLDADVKTGAEKICLLIGPEGDMSPKEYAAARLAGFKAANLGPNVMKCDTAALCALSVCLARLSTPEKGGNS